jgi:ubiquitin carboxyl-terminal hydrolase 1
MWVVILRQLSSFANVFRIALNTPSRRRSSLRPVQMIETLSTPASDGSNRSLLFSSREHQDAQELFQLLSSLLKEEAIAVDREGMKELGLGGALLWDTIGTKQTKEVAKGVLDGLTANRRSCVTCGYTEALMHFSFDNLQLSLPFAVSFRGLLYSVIDFDSGFRLQSV